MRNKDLQSTMMDALNKSGIVPEPPLAAAYKAAVMVVCEVDYVRISEWDYPRFQNRQEELDATGIDYDDYAASVVKSWWGWCKLHRMYVVSVPIFCGPKALARYQRDKIRHPNVEIDTLSEDIHQARVMEETLVAQIYISGHPFVSLMRVRDILSNFQVHPPDPSIVEEVLDLMNRAYGFDAIDYHQLVKQYRKRHKTYGEYNSSEANTAIQIENIGVFAEAWLD